MTAVPEGYPIGLNDAELEQALESMLDPSSWPGFDNFERLLPELKTALLMAGLQERARRETVQLRREAARDRRLAYVVLAVAVATLVASIVIALSA